MIATIIQVPFSQLFPIFSYYLLYKSNQSITTVSKAFSLNVAMYDIISSIDNFCELNYLYSLSSSTVNHIYASIQRTQRYIYNNLLDFMQGIPIDTMDLSFNHLLRYACEFIFSSHLSYQQQIYYYYTFN